MHGLWLRVLDHLHILQQVSAAADKQPPSAVKMEVDEPAAKPSVKAEPAAAAVKAEAAGPASAAKENVAPVKTPAPPRKPTVAARPVQTPGPGPSPSEQCVTLHSSSPG